MADYELGETVIIGCSITSTDGTTPVDPNSLPQITIVLDGATRVTEDNMEKDSVGEYHYDYLTDGIGRHYIYIKASQISPDRITIEKDIFSVISSY